VLTVQESQRLERGLDAVASRLRAGATPVASDEDVHTMIDRLLHEEVGDLASKLHTGRSRNDQVATATRLWAMDACTVLDAHVRELQHVMLGHAETIALLGTHLSRLAEDLVLYGSSEFGFVQYGDAFTTGSSMMPQKRNPDALELAR